MSEGEEPTPPTSAVRTGAVLTVLSCGLAVPIALFFIVRIPMGCSVLNFLHLPWPPMTEAIVQGLAIAIAAVAVILVVRALMIPHLRWTALSVLIIWPLLFPAWFLVLFISVYGDPDPTTCEIR